MLGGLGHTLPFLVSDVRSAVPVASVIVVIELLIISWLRFHYFQMPLLRSAFQVIVGGALVFAAAPDQAAAEDWSSDTWPARVRRKSSG
jgi:erythrin-vacuolar iron transport family protein